jgi:hypothetical protein
MIHFLYCNLTMSIFYDFCFVLFIVITTVVVVPTAASQDVPSSLGGAQQGYVNDFSRPGQATILVNVWGNASKPGLWRVERTIDLIDFLSVVGVPGIGMEEPGMRSTTYIAIYRTVNGARRQTYREKVDDLLSDGAAYPTLGNNDIVSVEVERRRSVGLQLVGTVVGTASSITLLILRLSSN